MLARRSKTTEASTLWKSQRKARYEVDTDTLSYGQNFNAYVLINTHMLK